MEIEDNFLEQTAFNELQTLMMHGDFAWYYNDHIDVKNEDKGNFQFCHTFYKNFAPHSTSLDRLTPIIKVINPISIMRIKTNLLTRTPNIVENSFHVDSAVLTDKILKQWTTSIFYMNTNNGYTEFEDGTQVESVANRMITFPSNLRHRGTSCTDENTRIVINFNYFK